jgi:hypothetical protein
MKEETTSTDERSWLRDRIKYGTINEGLMENYFLASFFSVSAAVTEAKEPGV